MRSIQRSTVAGAVLATMPAIMLSSTTTSSGTRWALTLVVDTVDPLYYDENAPGGSVIIGGGSYVDIPLR